MHQLQPELFKHCLLHSSTSLRPHNLSQYNVFLKLFFLLYSSVSYYYYYYYYWTCDFSEKGPKKFMPVGPWVHLRLVLLGIHSLVFFNLAQWSLVRIKTKMVRTEFWGKLDMFSENRPVFEGNVAKRIVFIFYHIFNIKTLTRL